MPDSTTYPHPPPKLLLISTKSYFSPRRTLEYLHQLLDDNNAILPALRSQPDLLFALIPDFLTILPCADILRNHITSDDTESRPIRLGAQDCFWESYGAYTGEIVPEALDESGVSIVELGHAERRRLLAETDETVARKAAAVSRCRMIPLVCIGELNKPDLQGPLSMAVGNAISQLRPQIMSALAAVPQEAPIIFAYEPVWAIGAEEPAGVDYVGPVVQAVRDLVGSAEKKGRTGTTRVVYGGSAGPGLWSGKANDGNGLGKWVDGMFLGRFAHEIEGVRKVVEEVVVSMKSS